MLKDKLDQRKTEFKKNAPAQAVALMTRATDDLTENREQKKTLAQKNRARRLLEKKTRAVSITAGLAADLENAVDAKDNEQTDRLIERIKNSTDKKSPYYLKLQAFQLIRNKEYEQARQILNKVLAKNHTDFEAHLNMAIIEIETGEVKPARKRLENLHETDPTHILVEKLLRNL